MTFIRWMQERLNYHLYYLSKIAVDGVFGPQTRTRLVEFQKRKRLPQTGTATTDTVVALRRTKDRKLVEAPEETMPPWLAEMTRRMGLHERTHNRTLSSWLRAGRYLGNPAKLPWCGDAVETCFARTLVDEPLPNNPFWAQAWAEFGREISITVGAVGVIRWSSKAGHVGFVVDWTPAQVKLRGGNQSNMIKDAWFPRSKFIAFRWPISHAAVNYPPVKGQAGSGGKGSTR